MRIQVVIPARYNSGRLPGKPLLDLLGMPMIERTWRRVTTAVPPEQVLVATDDDRIAAHCEKVGIAFMMTSRDCLTGTDRVAEVARRSPADYFINVQGDEPLINPEDIRLIIEAAHRAPTDLHLGIAEVTSETQWLNPSVPKAVFREDGRLLYLSRASIPATKHLQYRRAWRPIWVYGFPPDALAAYAARGGKGMIEEIEDNESIRFLEMGYDIRLVPMSTESIAVDTQEDVELVEQALRERAKAAGQ